jgi:hypothetical protein
MAQGGHATYSSLLEQAWRAYKEKPHSIPAKDLATVPASLSLDDLHKTSLTNEESPWVKALLEILESGHAVAMKAITSNLIAFRELIERTRERSSAHAPGSESLSGSEVGDVPQLIKDAKRAVDAFEADHPRTKKRGKRSRKDEEGTA